MIRCGWCGNDPLYVAYHDNEWGTPVHGDQLLFEFLILEGVQAGLSWLTVLKKRENYRKAFHGFDCTRVAKYTETDVIRLLDDSGIVRNRLKIESAIINAKCVLEMRSRNKRKVRIIGHVPLALCGRHSETERLEIHFRTSRKNRSIGKDEQGPEETWVQVRGANDLLCFHASGGHGKRPHNGLFSVRRAQEAWNGPVKGISFRMGQGIESVATEASITPMKDVFQEAHQRDRRVFPVIQEFL